MPRAIKLNRRQRRKWAKYICHLRAEFPLSIAVTVRTVRMKKSWGYVQHHHGHNGAVIGADVRISNEANWHQRWEVLCHEWAHLVECASYGNWELLDKHGEQWGVMYSKVYRAVVDGLDEWREVNNLQEP